MLRRAFENEDNINIEGLVIDNERREVYLDRSRIEMTLKEFDLLKTVSPKSFPCLYKGTVVRKKFGDLIIPEIPRTIDVYL